jgi:hypothetical protein
MQQLLGRAIGPLLKRVMIKNDPTTIPFQRSGKGRREEVKESGETKNLRPFF